MGDKNPKKQKKKKRTVERPSMTPLPAEANVVEQGNVKQKKSSRGR